jgi:hypothetical protein
VGDEHHLFATRDGVRDHRIGNDGFARPGRRHKAGAAMAGDNLGADAGNDIPLIRLQLGCAHCDTLRIGDAGHLSAPSAAMK